MKRIFFLSLLIAGAATTSAQTITPILTTNGIGLIPAFNLNSPAGMVFVKANVTKYIEIAPDFAVDLKNGRPWFGDGWVRVNVPLDTAKRFIATAGFDYSPYFQSYGTNGQEITQTVIYLAYQGKLRYMQNKKNTVTLDYWYNRTAKKDAPYGIKGSYVSLMFSRAEEWKKISVFGNINTFYISFSDASKGFGISYDASIVHNRSGLFLGMQLVHTLSPARSTNMKTNFALSLGITKKLF